MVVGARRADLSISKTADLLGFSHTTISRVYREWSKKEKISSERQLCGWKCLVDVRGQRRMDRLVRDDRKATVTQITTRYNQGMQNTISEHTTRRTLKQMGSSSRRPHRVPLLSAKNSTRRIQFTQTHQNWTIEDWKNIAWSDESRFLLWHSDVGSELGIRTWKHGSILPCLNGGGVSVLTQCFSVWYNNATNQDCKALQRVESLAERISGSTLPSLQDIYLKRCKSRAAKIIKDSNHPGNHHFCLLPSGKRFRSMMAKTGRLRRSFFPQAIRLLNSVS